jgi:threonine dehydratase
MAGHFSAYKRAKIEGLGAEVVDTSGGNSERDATAAALAREEGLEYVSSHDHPLVMAGQGTMGLEIVEDAPSLETVFVPVGGGGMAAGVAVAVRAMSPATRIFGVEPVTADDTLRSLRAGHRVAIDPPDTICDGVRAQTPGKLTFPILQALLDDVVTVDDSAVTEAMYLLWREGITAEPSAALSVAAARAAGAGAGTVCILSGGNLTPEAHADLIRPWVEAEKA